jgi:hypothetical protein
VNVRECAKIAGIGFLFWLLVVWNVLIWYGLIYVGWNSLLFMSCSLSVILSFEGGLLLWWGLVNDK